MAETARLVPKDAGRLLVRIIEALAGDGAFISLEGFSNPTVICSSPGVVTSETTTPDRNAIVPLLRFVVVPLTKANVPTLTATVGQASTA